MTYDRKITEALETLERIEREAMSQYHSLKNRPGGGILAWPFHQIADSAREHSIELRREPGYRVHGTAHGREFDETFATDQEATDWASEAIDGDIDSTIEVTAYPTAGADERRAQILSGKPARVLAEERCICSDLGATGPGQFHTRCPVHATSPS